MAHITPLITQQYISSCSHPLHRLCSEKSKNTYTQENKQFLVSEEIQFFCTHCKSLSNAVVPVIDNFVQRTQLEQVFFDWKKRSFGSKVHLINQQVIANRILEVFHFGEERISLLKDSVNDGEKLKLLENVDQLFNQILFATINESTHENFILSVVLNSLSSMSESLFISNNLCEFMRRKFVLCKNLFLSFKLFFWHFDTNTKYQFIETFKMNMLEQIQQLLVVDTFIQSNLQNQGLLRLDEQLHDLLWSIGAVFLNTDQEFTLPLILDILKFYYHQLAFVFSFAFLFKDQIANTQIKKIIIKEEDLLSSLLKNQPFKYRILFALEPFIQLIVGFMVTFFEIDREQIEKLSEEKDDFSEDLELFNQIFDNFFDFDEVFLSTVVAPRLCEQFNNFNDQIKQSFYSAATSGSQSAKLQMMQLPSDFRTLVRSLLHAKCFLCNSFPSKKESNLYICLICSFTACSNQCPGSPKGPSGNLNFHATETHAGKCIFMNLLTSQILMIETPQMIFYDHLYKNSLSIAPSVKYQNLESFQLDKNLKQELEKIIVGRTISQKTRYFLMQPDYSIGGEDIIYL